MWVWDVAPLLHATRTGHLVTLRGLAEAQDPDHGTTEEVAVEVARLAREPLTWPLVLPTPSEPGYVTRRDGLRREMTRQSTHPTDAGVLAYAQYVSGVAVADGLTARRAGRVHAIPVRGTFRVVADAVACHCISDQAATALVAELVADGMRLPAWRSGACS